MGRGGCERGNGKGKAGKAGKGKRGGWWGMGKGGVECIDGKVAVVLEVCLRHVYLSHTSVEIEPGSSGSIADSCVGTVVEEVKTGVFYCRSRIIWGCVDMLASKSRTWLIVLIFLLIDWFD